MLYTRATAYKFAQNFMIAAATKKRVTQSIGILVIGALLTGGGMFLWQNQFDISLFSSASSTTVQAVISIGEKSNEGIPVYTQKVTDYLQTKQSKNIEVTSRAEQGMTVSSLRDQAVLGYNDLTKPITEHVYFTVITGRSALINGIKEKESITSIANKVAKDISTFIDLTSARPGVFPEGYTVLLATLPDPLGGTGDATLCNGLIPNYGTEYTKSAVEEINEAIIELGNIYPQSIKIVNLATRFKDHGLNTSDTWFADCANLNQKGLEEAAKEFELVTKK